MENQSQGRPSWWTVGGLGFALTLATSLITGAVYYGRLDSNLSSAAAKINDLKEENGKLVYSLDEWRKAYEKQSNEIRLYQERISNLQNDRCSPLATQIADLEAKIESPRSYGYSPEEVDGPLKETFAQLNRTLQSCYNAKS